jgi:hypothetical protein
MPTFIGGSGAIALGNDIGGVAQDNGCYEGSRGVQVSMWEMWNLTYYMGLDFTSPYNFGFFYGQGCPGYLSAYLNFYTDPYNESLATWGLYQKANGASEQVIQTLDSAGLTCTLLGSQAYNTKTLGQSGNTVTVGVRSATKSPASAQYDGDNSAAGCPDTNYDSYGGTADYPSSCPGQLTATVNSSSTSYVSITVNVDKSGYFVTC